MYKCTCTTQYMYYNIICMYCTSFSDWHRERNSHDSNEKILDSSKHWNSKTNVYMYMYSVHVHVFCTCTCTCTEYIICTCTRLLVPVYVYMCIFRKGFAIWYMTDCMYRVCKRRTMKISLLFFLFHNFHGTFQTLSLPVRVKELLCFSPL